MYQSKDFPALVARHNGMVIVGRYLKNGRESRRPDALYAAYVAPDVAKQLRHAVAKKLAVRRQRLAEVLGIKNVRYAVKERWTDRPIATDFISVSWIDDNGEAHKRTVAEVYSL